MKMNNKSAYVLIVFLLCVSSVFADWERAGGPAGGIIYDMECQGNYLFVASKHGQDKYNSLTGF